MKNFEGTYMMQDKILIFTTRHLCYNSGDFFAAQLANGFEENGIECEYCELEFDEPRFAGMNVAEVDAAVTRGERKTWTGARESSTALLTEKSQRKLECYLGKSYLAVIDFNSRMPHMILDDGSYYLDGLDAPFYDYILDHPLYHHSTLSCQLKNFNVILLDRNQCDCVREYYPWIENVIFQPLGGQQAISPILPKDKKLEVLFTGTYRDPETVSEQMVKEKDETIRDCMLAMIEWLHKNPNGTVEQALKVYLTGGCSNTNDHLCENSEGELMKRLNACYPVEIYIRNLYRKNLIDAFAKEKVPLRIVGDWWEQYEHFQDAVSITYQPAVSFARSFELINQSAVLLDSSPFFQYGIHDRVTAAMANRTIALTDENMYIHQLNHQESEHIRLTEKLVERDVGSFIPTYEVNLPEAAVERAAELLSNLAFREELAEQAYDLYQREFTWKRVAKRLLDIF